VPEGVMAQPSAPQFSSSQAVIRACLSVETFWRHGDTNADRETPLGPDYTVASTCPAALACASAPLCLRHVWPRPPVLRCQRDQARLLHPAAATDAERRAELERGPDGPASGGPLRCQSRRAQPGP